MTGAPSTGCVVVVVGSPPPGRTVSGVVCVPPSVVAFGPVPFGPGANLPTTLMKTFCSIPSAVKPFSPVATVVPAVLPTRLPPSLASITRIDCSAADTVAVPAPFASVAAPRPARSAACTVAFAAPFVTDDAIAPTTSSPNLPPRPPSTPPITSLRKLVRL